MVRKRRHFWIDKWGRFHLCEGGQIAADDPGTYVVWTLCGQDVPANKSFKSAACEVTCPECEEVNNGSNQS